MVGAAERDAGRRRRAHGRPAAVRGGGSASSPAPTAARSSTFLLLATVSAALGVPRPGARRPSRRRHRRGRWRVDRDRLALIIAGVAVLDAGVGLLERWQSSRLGEGLILDLRRRVFDHVQRMPIAFFTRTRTGALVSRLNNDVIGAQRAFTSALSGVVTNVIALVLTLAVMIGLSLADHRCWRCCCCRRSSSRPAASGPASGGCSASRRRTTQR